MVVGMWAVFIVCLIGWLRVMSIAIQAMRISGCAMLTTIGKKTEITEEDTGYKITIPPGYTIADDSATEIKDGVVIKDESGNEFVWVPVPNAIANTEADITTMVITNNTQLQ